FYSDVNVVDSGPLAGWRWVYFSDPDGLALELVEVAYYLKDERELAAAAYLRTRPALASIEARHPAPAVHTPPVPTDEPRSNPRLKEL
ncbi:MAG: hypothetical protein ABWY81_09160, partial [Jiangellaceae bacterium]